MRTFAELVSGVIDELALHESYAERWDVSLEGVKPVEATLAYTDFLLATASLGGVGETCAAMTPCMRLYAFLGRSVAGKGYDEGNPYSGWIQTYADPEFEALAAKLEALLDRYAADAPAVLSAYRRALALEFAFFKANAEGLRVGAPHYSRSVGVRPKLAARFVGVMEGCARILDGVDPENLPEDKQWRLGISRRP